MNGRDRQEFPHPNHSSRRPSRAPQRGRGHIHKGRIEVVAAFVVDGTDNRTTLQTSQRLHLLSRPCTGISQFELPVGHVLPAKAECHVAAALGGAWERHRQIAPQQSLYFI